MDEDQMNRGKRSSKAIKTLGPELAGPKAMLMLGSNPVKDKEAKDKADRFLKQEIYKQQRKKSSIFNAAERTSNSSNTSDDAS
jgi:hypothetical protein